MRQKDRLSPLKVCVAGHDRVLMSFCHGDEGLLKRAEECDNIPHLLSEIQPEIKRHLVIPRAGGMKFLARLADPGGER